MKGSMAFQKVQQKELGVDSSDWAVRLCISTAKGSIFLGWEKYNSVGIC